MININHLHQAAVPSMPLFVQDWHLNSVHIPLKYDDGGLLPSTYLQYVALVQIKLMLISECIEFKSHVYNMPRSPLTKDNR